jgi:hypothetical protein
MRLFFRRRLKLAIETELRYRETETSNAPIEDFDFLLAMRDTERFRLRYRDTMKIIMR